MVKKKKNNQPVENKEQTEEQTIAETTHTQNEESLKNESAFVSDTGALQAKMVETFKNAHKQVNIPNMLTIFRIWTIPVVVLTFFFTSATAAWIGVFLFALASITDY